jgi:predicted RNase H-like HicB family nuclease
LDEVKTIIREALELHFEGLRGAGLPIPPPTSVSDYFGEAG